MDNAFDLAPEINTDDDVIASADEAHAISAVISVRRSRVFGQLPGENKLRPVAGCWFHLSPKSNSSCLVAGCCEACGQPPTCGQGGGNAWRFPSLSIGDRACAVRRGSAQPTVHKFTAPPRHGVRRPVPTPPSIGRGTLVRCSPAERLMRTPQIIPVEELAKAALLFDAVGRWTQVDPFVLHGPPQALDEDVGDAAVSHRGAQRPVCRLCRPVSSAGGGSDLQIHPRRHVRQSCPRHGARGCSQMGPWRAGKDLRLIGLTP